MVSYQRPSLSRPPTSSALSTNFPSFDDLLFFQYAWMLGWLRYSEDRPDVKINAIYPATDVHIRKVIPRRPMITTRTGYLNNSLFIIQYSNQQVHIVRETPALYERIVKPYIDAFPASRTQWLVWPLHPPFSRAQPSHPSLIDSSVFINI